MSLCGVMKTCLASTLKWPCIVSTSNWMPIRSNSSDSFAQTSWRQLKLEFINSSNVASWEQHPEWVANIVPIPKKNEKFRVCIDFCNLNTTCPTNKFSCPSYIMIDNTCGFKRMFFMDSFLGYNQIKMYPDDNNHTSFQTLLGVYYYTVISFGLKNFNATYQCAMSTISVITYGKWWNIMLTTSQSKVAIRTTTFTI